jgi:ketosteroid isomerase-like protein
MPNQIQAPAGPTAAADRLRDAINSHDLDAMVACFSPDVCSRQPLHPSRQFQGSENIRQNWAMIFGGVPDIRAELLRTTVAGNTAWAEWHWSGNSRDGRAFDMRGVTVQEVVDGAIADVSLYMEPVEADGGGNADAIQAAVGTPR